MYISLISKSAFSSATENDDKYNYVLLDMVKSKHLGEGGGMYKICILGFASIFLPSQLLIIFFKFYSDKFFGPSYVD